MKSLKLALVLSAVPLAAGAQDPVKVDAGHYKVLIDNPSVRVLKVAVSPGAKSPMHAHPDAMLVALGDAKVRFTAAGREDRGQGDRQGDGALHARDHACSGQHRHDSRRRDPGGVQGEGARHGQRALLAHGMHTIVLAESPRGIAIKSTAAADFHEAPGTAHDYDQVVISLGANDLSLAIDGKPTVTNWQRGTAQFIGRGVKHESKNTSGRPVDFVILAIK